MESTFRFTCSELILGGPEDEGYTRLTAAGEGDDEHCKEGNHLLIQDGKNKQKRYSELEKSFC